MKDGEAAETSPNKSRSQSQTSGSGIDGAVPVEAEGFLCPSCMAAFSSPDDLQNHYQNDHLDPGANYLCPVCKARLTSAEELELHFSANHSKSSINSGDVETLVKQIGELTSSLSAERYEYFNLLIQYTRMICLLLIGIIPRKCVKNWKT